MSTYWLAPNDYKSIEISSDSNNSSPQNPPVSAHISHQTVRTAAHSVCVY